MVDDQSAEVLFRASKRRKVLRKPLHQNAVEAISSFPEDTAITKHDQGDEEHDVGGLTKVQKKAVARKLGIGFSSGDSTRNTTEDQYEEHALVTVGEDGMSELPKIDRFVKPTGRVGVSEDKHMMAYVDSKLAEARPSDIQSKSPSYDTDNGPRTVKEATFGGKHPDSNSTTSGEHRASTDKTYQQAQARSTRVYQRPTKRRPPPAREQTDVARDSMIDLIMGENQVPHYDRSLPVTQGDGDGEDEAAEEEAFKARLLADLERNKRRPPLQKSSASTSTGPKLGGSRSAREKMRALEEAKGNSVKK